MLSSAISYVSSKEKRNEGQGGGGGVVHWQRIIGTQ